MQFLVHKYYFLQYTDEQALIAYTENIVVLWWIFHFNFFSLFSLFYLYQHWNRSFYNFCIRVCVCVSVLFSIWCYWKMTQRLISLKKKMKKKEENYLIHSKKMHHINVVLLGNFIQLHIQKCISYSLLHFILVG